VTYLNIVWLWVQL